MLHEINSNLVIQRQKVFKTLFSAPSNYGGSDVVHRAYQKSLENLGLDQVDLFLIHFPGVARLNASDVRNQKIREMTWASLEELYDDGRVNAIGVSNFTIRHLDEIASNHSVMPAVNQVPIPMSSRCTSFQFQFTFFLFVP